MDLQPYPLFGSGSPPEYPDTKRYAYNASGQLQYEGWASSSLNPQPTQAVWAIKMYTYSGTQLVLEQWANGSSSRTNVWNNAASLGYQ